MNGLARATVLAAALCAAGAFVGAQQEAVPPAPGDNSFCLVCHINFAEEDLAARHVAKGIACTTCHGDSFDHRDDESHRTPPDVLYGRAEVEPFCKGCHEAHKSPGNVEAYRLAHKGETRPNGRTIRRTSVCTDCHGVHVVHPTK